MADVKAKVKTPKKKASKREKKDWIAAYILIAPVTLGLLVFYIWPFIQNVWFSFNDVNKFNMSTWQVCRESTVCITKQPLSTVQAKLLSFLKSRYRC